MFPYLALGDLVIFSYPFFIGLAWALAYRLSSPPQKTLFFVGNFVASWVGAKVFYLLTVDYLSHENIAANYNFWLGGGFVFYGGLIFSLGFTWFFLRKTKNKLESLGSLLPIVPLAHGVGRLGCFLAGCCYGSVTNSALSIYLHQAHRHPVQLYEAIFLFGLSYVLTKRKSLSFYLVSYGIFRFLIEFLRGDEIRGVKHILSSSQWISLILVMLVVFRQVKRRVS